ncbi:enoyl-CoA hydratase/isomerase family protein [Actinomadura vinacea]|uniref:enoyl-CoA hydratase/isomerase family protein n=1 Tax=Actinomadura vinacea TaxID=115336 RepID=UPI0031CEA95F
MKLHRRGPVTVLTLNRPERLNAVTPEMIHELDDALGDASGEPGCRVIILTGAGRGFCSGLDLEVGFGDPAGRSEVAHNYRFMESATRITERLRSIGQPVIAALHGPVVGVGVALAAAADIRIADASASFGFGFVRLGMSAGEVGLSWFLPRIIGPARAAEILFTGRTLTAAEAESAGLVIGVERGAALARAHELAAEIAARPAFSITVTKELLNASTNGAGFAEHLELEKRTQVLCSLTEEFTAARERFASRDRA